VFKTEKMKRKTIVEKLSGARGEANCFVTPRGWDCAELLEIALGLIESTGILIYIPASTIPGPGINRIGAINETLGLIKSASYVVLDSLQDMIVNDSDKEERDAFFGLCKSWADQLGCAVTVIDRRI
jgi:hypothetical protein